MKFDPSLIKESAKEDFDKAWQQGREYLGKPSLNERYPRNSYTFGAVHPIFDTIQKLREAYICLGFSEAMNPVMVEASDVYRQFGSEALAVLDRCFYLAGLPTPDIGMSSELAIDRSKTPRPRPDDPYASRLSQPYTRSRSTRAGSNKMVTSSIGASMFPPSAIAHSSQKNKRPRGTRPSSGVPVARSSA